MQSFENKSFVDELIVGFLKRELSNDQVRELTHWIQQSKENKRYFDEFREIWLTSKAMDANTKYNYRKAFDSFLNTIEEDRPVFPVSRTLWLNIAKVAAIFIVAFLLGGLVFTRVFSGGLSFGSEKYSEIVVPLGAKANFTLMDGTQVTLNAGSKLRYKSDYGRDNRIVELEGEGYFKVAKDKKRAFIVTTSHMSVKALGTEFNVKAYPGDKTIETTLVEGSVKIEKFSNATASEVILKPNQKLTFFKEEEIPAKSSNDAALEKDNASAHKATAENNVVTEDVKVEPLISWKENRWIIEKQDLLKLAVELERKFDIQIQFRTERLKNFTFTGTLLDEPLEQVLKVMSITAPINYEIKGKIVTFTEKENFENIYRKLYE